MKPKNDSQAKYKTCIYCGTEWNVSVRDKYDRYICPVCRNKAKRECTAYEQKTILKQNRDRRLAGGMQEEKQA